MKSPAPFIKWFADITIDDAFVEHLIGVFPRAFFDKMLSIPGTEQAIGKLAEVVQWTIRWRRTVVLATVALLVLSGAGMGMVKQQFFPSSTRLELMVDLKLAEGSTLPDEHLTLSLAAARLLKHGVVVEVLTVE